VSGAEEHQHAHGSTPSLMVLLESLGLQALIALGELPGHDGQPGEVDLPQAKYTIDLLQVLRDKTAGNRDEDEDHLLDRLLYDLRMKFVARAGSS
jgi:hypothetical protein